MPYKLSILLILQNFSWDRCFKSPYVIIPAGPPPAKTIIDFTPSAQSGNPVVGGHLIVDSSPQGATVYIDDSEVGITPLVLKNYPIGNYNLVYKLNNHIISKINGIGLKDFMLKSKNLKEKSMVNRIIDEMKITN